MANLEKKALQCKVLFAPMPVPTPVGWKQLELEMHY